LIGRERRRCMHDVLGSVPDQGFPPGFFDDAEDEEAQARAEIDREDAWDEAYWQEERT